ncbi:MAG: spermidine/putrescine ABC transporter substrate-binding protein [Tateyamaria sp.]|uniref:polyamine ABC transporter substrate-binding protein n=2 Tax=Tateyamaria sp. TaxID=1929288 RepID=UPI00326F80A2
MKKSNEKKQKQYLRRDVLRISGGVALSAPFVGRAWASTTEINMLAWYGHGEPDMVGAFEEANNVKFVPKYYAGGDNMLALIAQSPPGTYDIILSDGEFVQQLNAAGYIEALDASDYPFDDMLHEDFTKFPGHWDGDTLYSMILRGGHLGVSYNTTAMSAEEASSYEGFWKPELQGKVGHFDWHLPSLGMMSLKNGNGAGLWDLSDDQWQAVQDTTMSLRPQVGGYFDYGGTFNGLKNGEMLAMCGIGDWITGVLERDGAPVASVIPKEGGIQFTESYCIGKGSAKADLVKKFIQYMMSPEGQVKSAQMAAYPGFCVTKAGRAMLQEVDPKEAKRSHQMDGMPNDPIALINEGRIHYRDIPQQQTLEDWNDFWSEYKNA